MSNKKVGSLKVKNTLSFNGDMPEPFKCKGSKETNSVYIYFQNIKKGTCTCIIKSTLTGEVKGIGIARCNPNDRFDLTKGTAIAEYRAKINQYEKYIKAIGKE